MARAHAAEMRVQEEREAANRPGAAEVAAAVEIVEGPGRSTTPPSAWTVPWAAFRTLIEWYELRGDERMAALLEFEMEQMAERKSRARQRLTESLE